MRVKGAHIPARDRFDLQYDKAGKDECWNWKYSKSTNGYGRFFFEGKSRIASRLAYIFANGPIQDDLCVLHNCDNPACVNPSHLRLGTLSDNTRDILKRGRWQEPPKLNHEVAARLKASISERGTTLKAIAAAFGLSYSTVKIFNRRHRHEI